MRSTVSALLILLSSVLAMGQVKFGVVDIKQVYEAMPEMSEAKTRLATASTEYQSELEQMRSEFQKKYADYQSLNAGSATDIIKERRVQELQELDQRIQRFVASAATSMEQLQQQLLQPIEDRVVEAVKAVGHEGGFTMIYGDLSAANAFHGNYGMQPLYLSDEVVDVTPEVLARVSGVQ